MEKPDKEHPSLAGRLNVPRARLAVPMFVVVIASLVALGAVVVLGVKMLETLSRQAEAQPEHIRELDGRLQELSERVRELELSQKEMAKRIAGVSRLADELYLTRPQAQEEKEMTALAALAPTELIKFGMAALSRKGEDPGLYFGAILENFPDSPEAQRAMLQLGRLKLRGGDAGGARELLAKYLDRYAGSSPYDTAQVNFYLGAALGSLDRGREAVRHYTEALKGFPGADLFRATTHANLAELYAQFGEREKAAREFEVLIEEFGTDRRADNMVKRARQMLESLRPTEPKAE